MNLVHRYMDTDHYFAYTIIDVMTYAIAREQAPVYTIGTPSPTSFQRGKRGIAGTMKFKRPLFSYEYKRLAAIGTFKARTNDGSLREFIGVDFLSEGTESDNTNAIREQVTFIARKMR